MLIRRWNISQPDTALAAELSEACEINPFLSLLLTTRGLTAPEEFYAFLAGQEEELDPLDYADMSQAAARIRQALEQGERILVYGDYDVDGITATVLLYTYLQEQGADVLYRIPTREEGYGLHADAVHWAAEQGVRLIVSVDTGVTAVEECRLATELGMDVVVTDHHQPGSQLPVAAAVVDPHRADCEGACKDLAGVGVAFLLACTLEGDGEKVFRTYGDLLTLGTLADVMPLQGFTRDLMRRGLALLNESGRPGLVALRKVAGLEEKDLTATSAVFSLVPRLNAAGRMGDPALSMRLLLCRDTAEAEELAAQLQQLNTCRQDTGNDIIKQADALLLDNPHWLYDRVLVIAGEGWHHGLLGIIAARMVERYGKPALVLSVGEDGIAHGSGRSLPGFSLFEALQGCSQVLTAFGGHDQAAGVTLPGESVSAFREAVNAVAARLCPVMPVPSLDVAVRLRPDQISTEKLPLLDALEPTGAGNPAPLFGLFRMQLDNITALGGGKHIRLSLSRDGVRINAVKFQTPPEDFPIPCGSTVNCVVSLDKNDYRGNLTVSVRVRDISFADTDREQLIADVAAFDSLMRGESCPAKALPSREQMTLLYSLLRACKDWNGNLEQLQHALAHAAQIPVPTGLQILVALEIWQQAGLLSWQDKGERLSISLLPAAGKADLTSTPLWRYLERGETDV